MRLPHDTEPIQDAAADAPALAAPVQAAPERFMVESSGPERGFYWPMAGVALLLAVMLAGLSPLVRNAGGPFAGASPQQYAPLQSTAAQSGAEQNIPAQGASLTGISWQPTYEAARAAAYAARKPLMIDFYADWCMWCKKMDSDTYTNRRVIEESRHFVSVKINTEQRPDLARQYGVYGLPATIWIDNAGNIVENSSGYLAPAQFAQWMRSARSKFTPPS